MPQVWPPASIRRNATPPGTSVGVSRSAPVRSAPAAAPQQYALLSVVSPQVCARPPETSSQWSPLSTRTGVSRSGGGAVPELAVASVTPAESHVRQGHRTGVAAPRPDLAPATPAGHEARRALHLAGGAVAELAIAAVAPAPGPVVGGHAADVV